MLDATQLEEFLDEIPCRGPQAQQLALLLDVC